MSDSASLLYYESDRILSEYLLFHYGSDSEVLPYSFGPKSALNYPVRCVRECLDTSSLPSPARALDLGCAVGGSSFELARHAGEVIGVDTSVRFIEAANRLSATGKLAFDARTEGDLSNPAVAVIPPEIDRNRVRFQVGDALDLPDDLGSFDVVLMANLIDRVPRPLQLLERLPELLNPGGQLIIASPYTWLEEFTPRDQWLGGFERDGHSVSTFTSLHEHLSPSFDLTIRKDLPFLIREHARKFQWSVAEATVWQRKPGKSPGHSV